MRNICIIPARGGSKRIPNKNIKEFLGKPIIAYSIDAAIKSDLFEEIMVSTDSAEISEIAKSYGAKVPFLRSVINSTDDAGTASVLTEVLNQYDDLGMAFDNACCLYPAAPLVTSCELTETHNSFIENQLDSIFPVAKFSTPILRSYKLSGGLLKMNWPEHRSTRTQDLDDAYYDTGQFYWFNVKKFQLVGDIITDNCGGMEVSEAYCQDIDNLVDWEIAEIKYKYKFSNKSKS